MKSEQRLIYVCGTPRGGTSAVAGMLHHLGVDMGEPLASVRPYEMFEDRNCSKWEAEPTRAQAFIMNGGRNFRGYIESRLRAGVTPNGDTGAASRCCKLNQEKIDGHRQAAR